TGALRRAVRPGELTSTRRLGGTGALRRGCLLRPGRSVCRTGGLFHARNAALASRLPGGDALSRTRSVSRARGLRRARNLGYARARRCARSRQRTGALCVPGDRARTGAPVSYTH
ncbi:hypothetical protein ADK38_47395, partial [Streptomyces varsoviensis]